MDLVEQKDIPLWEVAELLRKRQKDGELSYEQLNTLEYAEKFALKEKEAKELARELKPFGLSEKHVIMMVNTVPRKDDEVRAIVGKEFGEDKIKEIAKVTKAYKRE